MVEWKRKLYKIKFHNMTNDLLISDLAEVEWWLFWGKCQFYRQYNLIKFCDEKELKTNS